MFDEHVAAHPAMLVSRCLNALGHLVSGAAWADAVARVGEGALRGGISDAIESAQRALAAGGVEMSQLPLADDPDRLRGSLDRLSSELGSWRDGAPPATVREAAQEALDALGVPEPADGWERFRPDAP